MDILRKTMIFVAGGVTASVLLNSCLSLENLFYQRQPLHDKKLQMCSDKDINHFFATATIKRNPGYVADSAGKLNTNGFYTCSQFDLYPDTCIIFYPNGFMKFFDVWGIYKVTGDTINANINFYQESSLFFPNHQKAMGLVTFKIEDSTHIKWVDLKTIPEFISEEKFKNQYSKSYRLIKTYSLNSYSISYKTDNNEIRTIKLDRY